MHLPPLSLSGKLVYSIVHLDSIIFSAYSTGCRSWGWRYQHSTSCLFCNCASPKLRNPLCSTGNSLAQSQTNKADFQNNRWVKSIHCHYNQQYSLKWEQIPALLMTGLQTTFYNAIYYFSEDHLIIFIPEVSTHLLDIGLMHEPCCHITTKPLITDVELDLLCLAPLLSPENSFAINLATLDLIDLKVPTSLLIETFKSDTLLENKLSILHYLILHSDDVETAYEVCNFLKII